MSSTNTSRRRSTRSSGTSSAAPSIAPRTCIRNDTPTAGENPDVIVIAAGSSPSAPERVRQQRRRRRRLNLIPDAAQVIDLTCLNTDTRTATIDLTQSPPPNPLQSTRSTSKKSLRTPEPVVRLKCPVCLETAEEVLARNDQMSSTYCGHIFCKKCIRQVLNTTKSCPTCRTRVTESKVHRLFLCSWFVKLTCFPQMSCRLSLILLHYSVILVPVATFSRKFQWKAVFQRKVTST